MEERRKTDRRRQLVRNFWSYFNRRDRRRLGRRKEDDTLDAPSETPAEDRPAPKRPRPE